MDLFGRPVSWAAELSSVLNHELRYTTLLIEGAARAVSQVPPVVMDSGPGQYW